MHLNFSSYQIAAGYKKCLIFFYFRESHQIHHQRLMMKFRRKKASQRRTFCGLLFSSLPRAQRSTGFLIWYVEKFSSFNIYYSCNFYQFPTVNWNHCVLIYFQSGIVPELCVIEIKFVKGQSEFEMDLSKWKCIFLMLISRLDYFLFTTSSLIIVFMVLDSLNDFSESKV